MWHCGPFPPSLAKPNSQIGVGRHFLSKNDIPGCGQFELVGGDLTFTRFEEANGEYSLFMGQGQGCEGPYTRGTYLWAEVPDWPKWEEKIVRCGYLHHTAGIHGHIAPALYEASRYIPGLRPDPVDPTAEQIEAWLRGRN
jgi:hypothetical protein